MKKEERQKPNVVKNDVSEEIHDEDFQYVLKELLDILRPIIEEELRRSDSLDEMKAEIIESSPSCEDELRLAERIFDRFSDPETALRLLDPITREKLEESGKFRWCLSHLACCLKYGWLTYRARTFRAAVYYLYRYWICFRKSIDIDPSDRPLTNQEKKDIHSLVNAFAEAYRPFLAHQVRSAEFTADLPDDLISGNLNCFEGIAESYNIFDRFMTAERMPALMGEEFYAKYSKDSGIWFCRCWCLCAIKFGWCLARSQDIRYVTRCLLAYRHCLRTCFGPLTCEITGPVGCAEEEANTDLNAMVVPVSGSAGGGSFHHYLLEWSKDSVNWYEASFRYPPIPPGGTVQGTSPVFSGLLAYFDTTALDPGSYLIRMTVHSANTATKTCTASFCLYKKEVAILAIDGYYGLDKVWTDPTAKFVEAVPALCSRPGGTSEMSFGECISIQGSAVVGGCDKKKIKRYTIDYKKGDEPDPTTAGWVNILDIEYSTNWQYRDKNLIQNDTLTRYWNTDCVVPFFMPPFCLDWEPNARLDPTCWATHTGTCQLSGLFTIRLTVEDIAGTLFYDTQRVWIDNKPMCAVIRIDAVPKCGDLYVSSFAHPPDCSKPWGVPVRGIAYDEYIDDALPTTRPNDNFDYYTVYVEKQGGPEIQIPIPGPGLGVLPGGCYSGVSRVGDPGDKCPNPSCDKTNLSPSSILGLLAVFDLRAVDPVCKSSVPYNVPKDFTIERGTCCVYTFKLWVFDRTKYPGGPHWVYDSWPVKICNDLKPEEIRPQG